MRIALFVVFLISSVIILLLYYHIYQICVVFHALIYFCGCFFNSIECSDDVKNKKTIREIVMQVE